MSDHNPQQPINMPRTPADGADSLSQMMGEMDTSQQTSSGGGLMNELYTVHQSETTLILRCAGEHELWAGQDIKHLGP